MKRGMERPSSTDGERRKTVNKEEIEKRIRLGRDFITDIPTEDEEDYVTDQYLHLPQPPLVKAPMREESLVLPRDFNSLAIDGDFLHIVNSRSSHRVYTEEGISLEALSYLLWCTQGIKGLRGKSYATLRTVPCGGARHEFETYMIVRNVSGLEPGLYHYLPMTHSVECLTVADDAKLKEEISVSLCEQKWASKADVVFYYSAVHYRVEWRYGIHAHRVMLIDAGHITENLYLACTSIGLGGCAVGALETPYSNDLFGLDGEEETIFYAMPVGTIKMEDEQKEKDFYAFVREEGL